MSVSKDSIRKLIARAEEMKIQVDDFLNEDNYKDGFIVGMLWNKGIKTNEEALAYCVEHNIKCLDDLLNDVAKDLWGREK